MTSICLFIIETFLTGPTFIPGQVIYTEEGGK